MRRDGTSAPEAGKTLRVHHLLCIPLFVGEGYSDSFSVNMRRQIGFLDAAPETEVTLVCEPDGICAGCPNLQPDHTCGSDRNHVELKDRELAQMLGIVPGKTAAWRALLAEAKEHLTQEMFDASCGNCQWYQAGLCTFQKWKKGLAKHLKTEK